MAVVCGGRAFSFSDICENRTTLNLGSPVEGGLLCRRASLEALVGVSGFVVVVGEVGRHLGDRERGSGSGEAVEGRRTVAADPDATVDPHRLRHGDSTGVDPPAFTGNDGNQGDAEEDPTGESGTEVHRVFGAVRSGDGDGGGGPAVVAVLGGLASLARRVGDGGENLTSGKLITDAGTTCRFHLFREPVGIMVIDLDL